MGFPITSQCAPDFRGSTNHTIESFPVGKDKDRETESVAEERAESTYASEVKRIMAIRTTEIEWLPVVVRLLDGWDLEVKRTVIE